MRGGGGEKGGGTRKKGRVSNSRGEVEQKESGRERRVRKGRCKQQRLNRGREENTLKQFHTRELQRTTCNSLEEI